MRPKSTLAAWISGKHVLKFLWIDFSAASDAALGWVNELGKIGNSETNVLYTNWPPDEARRLGYEGPCHWRLIRRRFRRILRAT